MPMNPPMMVRPGVGRADAEAEADIGIDIDIELMLNWIGVSMW